MQNRVSLAYVLNPDGKEAAEGADGSGASGKGVKTKVVVTREAAGQYVVAVGATKYAVEMIVETEMGVTFKLGDAVHTVAFDQLVEDEIFVANRAEVFHGPLVAERELLLRHVSKGASASGRMEIKAPMPGRVVRIPVAVGEVVKAGQGVIAVEAMKMENELKAAGDGVVAEIRAKVGDNCDRGAVLVVIDPPVAAA